MAATEKVDEDSTRKSIGLRFLSQFGAAHDALADAMREIDELTRGPLPSRDKLASARLRISRASLRRRTIGGSIYKELMLLASPREKTLLNDLQMNDINWLRLSTEHVAAWTLDAAMENWEGYCRASARIRWTMKKAMQIERQILIPIMSRL